MNVNFLHSLRIGREREKIQLSSVLSKCNLTVGDVIIS